LIAVVVEKKALDALSIGVLGWGKETDMILMYKAAPDRIKAMYDLFQSTNCAP
jgi:hypothetical protein